MKKIGYLICLLVGLSACVNDTPTGDYPVIDVAGSIGNYQRVYCSDYFSSIELIPLETNEDCLVNNHERYSIFEHIIYTDEYIFMLSRHDLLSFDHTGKYLNTIGREGQGPGEYLRTSDIFIDSDESTIFVSDNHKILEYDFRGKFIRSFPNPIVENKKVSRCSYVGKDLFVGQFTNKGNNQHKYCLFNKNGDTVKCFPNSLLFDITYFPQNTSLRPIHVDDRIYLKDYFNDTVYNLVNHSIQPSYILGLGKSNGTIESLITEPSYKFIKIMSMLGTPKYLFYCMHIPESFPRPKAKKEFSSISNQLESVDMYLYGIYNISANTNILLDTGEDLQKGIINDINGGLPFFPRYYAGNNVVVDIWYPNEMKEMLTEADLAKQTIKDQEGHRKLKALLKNLKDDDNPVVVVAKMK